MWLHLKASEEDKVENHSVDNDKVVLHSNTDNVSASVEERKNVA